jgi:hypothetical protein
VGKFVGDRVVGSSVGCFVGNGVGERVVGVSVGCFVGNGVVGAIGFVVGLALGAFDGF